MECDMAIMVDLPITLKGVFIRIAKRTVIGQCGRMQFWVISILVIFLTMGCGRAREPVPENETNTKSSGGNATLNVKPLINSFASFTAVTIPLPFAKPTVMADAKVQPVP